MSKNSILNDLEYDKTSGALTYKGVRYLLIRPETIIAFQKEMEKSLGEKAKEGFYQGGFRGGYLSSKKYKEVFKFSDKQIIEFMMRMGTEIGWGCLTLTHFDVEKGIIRVSVENSPFVRSYEKSSKGTCDLIRGVVGGMASVIFNQDSTASEVECVSKGFDRCVFIVDLKLNTVEFLNGKKILAVDDEPDILESIIEILDMCIVDTALDFETANDLLQKETYDA
ncbi:MAG: XylR N-terminal domain-containing protein, partial [Proteobacteria bacterium]|nr:XylR N-terminal domain-containing protein [Pseudomonadota bacterium]